ncbi:RusA family crossover junction endodeoxyribonuclease [Corynebacterium glyciniphilum]|uniref:RusA family crossover junction endodeoxyribonuclease n=1 Tax=Corynebacterium glyciniphilum TaxID=1404244 RepID=UPI003FD63FDA
MWSCSGWRVVRLTSFFAEGVPRPQGSKRAVGGGRFIEASKYLPEWRKSVVGAARDAHEGEPLQGAVTVSVEFVFPRPKALKPHQDAPPHTTTVDSDKLARAVGDALTIAGVFKDDSQVNIWIIHKRRARHGELPGAHVTVSNSPRELHGIGEDEWPIKYAKP